MNGPTPIDIGRAEYIDNPVVANTTPGMAQKEAKAVTRRAQSNGLVTAG